MIVFLAFANLASLRISEHVFDHVERLKKKKKKKNVF